jgi:hypothetical protein
LEKTGDGATARAGGTDNPFFKDIDSMADFRPRPKPIPVSDLTMAIKRTNAGLTPAVHRPSLDNEELVSLLVLGMAIRIKKSAIRPNFSKFLDPESEIGDSDC